MTGTVWKASEEQDFLEWTMTRSRDVKEAGGETCERLEKHAIGNRERRGIVQWKAQNSCVLQVCREWKLQKHKTKN